MDCLKLSYRKGKVNLFYIMAGRYQCKHIMYAFSKEPKFPVLSRTAEM